MRSRNYGYKVNQIGRYTILEGIGIFGGTWAARSRNEFKLFPSRAWAEEHARLSEGLE